VLEHRRASVVPPDWSGGVDTDGQQDLAGAVSDRRGDRGVIEDEGALIHHEAEVNILITPDEGFGLAMPPDVVPPSDIEQLEHVVTPADLASMKLVAHRCSFQML
jgi:hypothetical protein